jgi:hypothetical protein
VLPAVLPRESALNIEEIVGRGLQQALIAVHDLGGHMTLVPVPKRILLPRYSRARMITRLLNDRWGALLEKGREGGREGGKEGGRERGRGCLVPPCCLDRTQLSDRTLLQEEGVVRVIASIPTVVTQQ